MGSNPTRSSMIELSFAPWTDDQVQALKYWQNAGTFHPFTCGLCEGSPNLIPTTDGWHCDSCTYKQFWARSFMFESYLNK